MKIRVAHIVNPNFGSVFSGHSHYLFSLLSGWKEDGTTLDLLGTQIKPINMNSGDLGYKLQNGSLWSSNIKKQSRFQNLIWSFRLLGILIKGKNKYDIVHFHSLNWGSLVSPIILHLLNKKVIFTMSLFGNDNPSYLYKQKRGKTQTKLLRLFDGAIGLSPALTNDAINFGLRNVICLPNFMVIPELERDLDEFDIKSLRSQARMELNISQDAQMILFVGSIIYRKGVDTLISTFIELSKKYTSLLLVLIGPYSKEEVNGINEEFVAQLKKEIDFANLQDRVKWVGMLREHSTLINYYRSSDIFVFPTRNEGSPNVFAEAMAAGIPVVASLLSGITDAIVSDKNSGFLVEKDRVDKFAFVIDLLLQDNRLRIMMGTAGKKISKEKFGFKQYCQKLNQYYVDLLKDA